MRAISGTTVEFCDGNVYNDTVANPLFEFLRSHHSIGWGLAVYAHEC